MSFTTQQQQQHGNKFDAYMARLDAQLAARPARVIRTIDADKLMASIARHREEWLLQGKALTRTRVTVQEMYQVFGWILEDLGLEDATSQIVGVNHA